MEIIIYTEIHMDIITVIIDIIIKGYISIFFDFYYLDIN